MRPVSALSAAFLAYLLAVLPWLAFRSATRVKAARTAGGPAVPSRELIWLNTLVSLGLLFALAWVTGRSFGYRPFAVPAIGPRDLLAAAAAFGACFGMRAISRRLRTEGERRKLFVYRLAPRNPREWALWAATALAAGVAEEVAYRGVGMQLLWYALGSPWAAALLCAGAFALAHAMQGGKSMAVIFAIALVMHGLVAFTGTLVLAMVVHGGYDLAAGYLIAQEASRFAEVAEGSEPP